MIRLSIPSYWADEYIDPYDRALSDSCEAELTEIVLSHPRQAAWMETIRPEEIEKDLADGLSMKRRHGEDGPYFVLSGSRFDVFVQTRISLGDVTQAKITSVRPARGLGRTEAVVPAGVRLATLRQEQPCDLEHLDRIVEDGLRVLRCRRAALARARHGLRRSTPAARPRSDLHAEVRNRYRPLLQLLGLLEHRAALRDEAAGGSGLVVDGPEVGDRPATWIRLDDDTTIGKVRAVLVSTAEGGPASNLRLLATDELDNGRLVALSAARPRLRPGTPVRLRPYDGFALDKHRKALGRLLDDDVEGDWEHLALLLCAPDRLPVVPINPVPTYFDTSLSPEQRTAVDGAVGSPHAFHLHGPPGTGKTTVITEIVRQLTARGERVLLLAPMHVAVDEVMGRVADRPGILALRIAADETKVDRRMRKYLPEQAARTFLERARRPATSRADEWRARLAAADHERERIDRLIAAAEAHRRVVAEHAAAVAAHRRWHEQATAMEEQARQRCAAAVHAVRDIEARLAEATHRLLALQAYRASVPSPGRLRGWLSAVGIQAPGPQAQLEAELRAVGYRRDQLLREHSQTSAARDATFGAMRDIQEQHPRTAHELAAREQALDSAVLAAHMRLDTAAEAMHLTVVDPAAFAVGRLHGRSAALAEEISRLRQRIALEQRWFELSGLDRGIDDGLLAKVDADLRRSANLVCCTTTGLPRDLGDSDFDTLVVDEASRVVDGEFLIGAVRAQRWVLVGDEHQLPPYVETDDEHFLHAVTALHQLDRGAAPDVRAAVERLGRVWIDDGDQRQFRADAVEKRALELLAGDWTQGMRQRVNHAFNQLREPGEDPERMLLSAMSAHLVRSLFERNADAAPEALRSRLTMQHRMIEPIAALVREPVYGGQYLTPKQPNVEPLLYSGTNTPVVFVDTSIYGGRALASQVDNGFVNHLEAELIVTMCQNWDKRLTGLQHGPVSVSVLAFYKKQALLITEKRARAGHDFRTLRFQVTDSIDKIQGQQSDLVFVSFCRTTEKARPSADFARWLQDVRRLNVACTRARRSLVLVGHAPTLRKLNGVPAAEGFYRNLFALLAERTDVMTMTKGAT